LTADYYAEVTMYFGYLLSLKVLKQHSKQKVSEGQDQVLASNANKDLILSFWYFTCFKCCFRTFNAML